MYIYHKTEKGKKNIMISVHLNILVGYFHFQRPIFIADSEQALLY